MRSRVDKMSGLQVVLEITEDVKLEICLKSMF